ncbi:MAG: DUF4831 family protein [Rikenellaceae bacterium]
MKKTIIAAFGLTFAAMFAASAQGQSANVTVAPIGASLNNGVIEYAVAPSSAVAVRVVVKSENVEVGKYARYAQKYLGVRAPLVPKVVSTIESANIALAPLDYYIASQDMLAGTLDYREKVVERPELPLNMTSATALSDEQAAAAAAKKIFELRTLRKNILAANLGEALYSGGLPAALERIDREEEAYVEMFMGSTTYSYESRLFLVPMNEDTKRYIVCRISSSRGIVADSDMSADPLLLQISPAKVSDQAGSASDDRFRFARFRVANNAKCELFYGGKVVAANQLPLFEFGYDIAVPTNR